MGDCDLTAITADSLLKRRAILAKRLAPATVNLYWFTFSRLLTQAWVEWRWINQGAFGDSYGPQVTSL